MPTLTGLTELLPVAVVTLMSLRCIHCTAIVRQYTSHCCHLAISVTDCRA